MRHSNPISIDGCRFERNLIIVIIGKDRQEDDVKCLNSSTRKKWPIHHSSSRDETRREIRTSPSPTSSRLVSLWEQPPQIHEGANFDKDSYIAVAGEARNENGAERRGSKMAGRYLNLAIHWERKKWWEDYLAKLQPTPSFGGLFFDGHTILIPHLQFACVDTCHLSVDIVKIGSLDSRRSCSRTFLTILRAFVSITVDYSLSFSFILSCVHVQEAQQQ